MQYAWWVTVWGYARKSAEGTWKLLSLVLFSAVSSMAVSTADGIIKSKFVLDVLVAMEYACVAVEAVILLSNLMKHLLDHLRRTWG